MGGNISLKNSSDGLVVSFQIPLYLIRIFSQVPHYTFVFATDAIGVQKYPKQLNLLSIVQQPSTPNVPDHYIYDPGTPYDERAQYFSVKTMPPTIPIHQKEKLREQQEQHKQLIQNQQQELYRQRTNNILEPKAEVAEDASEYDQSD